MKRFSRPICEENRCISAATHFYVNPLGGNFIKTCAVHQLKPLSLEPQQGWKLVTYDEWTIAKILCV